VSAPGDLSYNVDRLVNADVYRARRGASMSGGGGGHGLPLGGLDSAMGDVFHGANYTGPDEPNADQDDEDAATSETPARPPGQADPATQGIVSVGGKLAHLRVNGDGTANVAHVGSSGGIPPRGRY